MARIFKRCIILVMFLFFSVGMGTGVAFGYLVNIDATDDAGRQPWETPYVQFDYGTDYSQHLAVSNAVPRWTSQSQVNDYVGYPGHAGALPENAVWRLSSAGNIWTGNTVGETLMGLSAGTYRITPVQATYLAFQRDGFNWTTPDIHGQYWWELQIYATNVIVGGNDYIEYSTQLGSSTSSTDPLALLNSVGYLDIIVKEGGSLTFWIYDINTVDNAGGLSVSVNMVPVPEPSTLLLLLLGVPFIVRKVRS